MLSGPGFLLDDDLQYLCTECFLPLAIICTPISRDDRKRLGCECGSGENRFDAVDAYLEFTRTKQEMVM